MCEASFTVRVAYAEPDAADEHHQRHRDDAGGDPDACGCPGPTHPRRSFTCLPADGQVVVSNYSLPRARLQKGGPPLLAVRESGWSTFCGPRLFLAQGQLDAVGGAGLIDAHLSFTLDLGVEFDAEQCGDVGEPRPDQERDDGSQGAVGLVE